MIEAAIESLRPDTAQALRLLALCPGPEINTGLAAAVLHVSPAVTATPTDDDAPLDSNWTAVAAGEVFTVRTYATTGDYEPSPSAQISRSPLANMQVKALRPSRSRRRGRGAQGNFTPRLPQILA